jgi:hypothetical protein
VELAARLAAALGPYWELREYLSEGRAWLERILNVSRPGVAECAAGDAHLTHVPHPPHADSHEALPKGAPLGSYPGAAAG